MHYGIYSSKLYFQKQSGLFDLVGLTQLVTLLSTYTCKNEVKMKEFVSMFVGPLAHLLRAAFLGNHNYSTLT